jgi:hypothetical protein
MNDFNGPMYFPSPFITGTVVTFGNPTVFTASTAGNPIGTFLTTGVKVYISGFSTTDPFSDGGRISAINSPSGYIATAIGLYQFSIPYDSTAMVGVSNATWTATVPTRRSVIPIVVSQLRPNVFN